MARKLTGRRVAVFVLLLIVAGIGCNPLMLPMYLFRDMRQGKIQSHFNFYDKAKAAKKKKEIKIVVLSERGRTLSAEFVGDERTLTNMIVNRLGQNFMMNKEKVTIVPPGDVEKFKNAHQDDWKSMETAEIAKHFAADYVIDIEFASVRLLEPRTTDLFSGRCHIPIRIVDADQNATEIFAPYDYDAEYPTGGALVPAGETTAERFKQKFYAKIAVDIAGLFSATETSQQFKQH